MVNCLNETYNLRQMCWNERLMLCSCDCISVGKVDSPPTPPFNVAHPIKILGHLKVSIQSRASGGLVPTILLSWTVAVSIYQCNAPGLDQCSTQSFIWTDLETWCNRVIWTSLCHQVKGPKCWSKGKQLWHYLRVVPPSMARSALCKLFYCNLSQQGVATIETSCAMIWFLLTFRFFSRSLCVDYALAQSADQENSNIVFLTIYLSSFAWHNYYTK